MADELTVVELQLAGWKELDGTECVAVHNRTRSKAEALTREFGVPAVYDDPEDLLHREKADFIDVNAGAAASPVLSSWLLIAVE